MKESLFCPAKINLGLRILYKRSDDGYHQIESVFVPIQFGDTLKIESNPNESGTFALHTEYEIEEKFQPPIESVSERGDYSSNLIYKAWSELCKHSKLPGLHFHLIKRIPAGSGLGGGSSNAGAVLLYAINQGWIDKSLGYKIASRLGADVPFFLQRSPCWVTGIGDILEPISIASGFGILYFPGIHLDTRSMYKDLKKSLQKPQPSKTWKEQERNVSFAMESGDWKSLRSVLRNDFEEVAFRIYPELGRACKRFLDWGADYSAMSGSGSTLFALFSSKERRDEALRDWVQEFDSTDFHSFSF